MATRRRLKVNIGLQRQRATPLYPSEPGYVQQMQAQSKMLTDTLLDILDQFEDASEEIMMEALEPTFAKAKYYCPKDTKALVDSAYLEVASFRGKPRVELGFAKGGKPNYAVYVHEIPDYNHAEPTRYKFLEQALKEDTDKILSLLGSGYRAFMGGARG